MIEEDRSDLRVQIVGFGNDFVETSCIAREERDGDLGTSRWWVCIAGKISSEYATIVKLRYPELAQRMQISYIADTIKDKYRRK